MTFFLLEQGVFSSNCTIFNLTFCCLLSWSLQMIVHTIPIMKEESFVIALVCLFSLFLPGWEVEKGGKGLFWRGACLLRGVSSLPAIKRKLRVNPPSLPRLITIYPHTDLKVKSQKKVRLKIIVIFFQTRFNFNFAPPHLFSFRLQTAVSAGWNSNKTSIIILKLWFQLS